MPRAVVLVEGESDRNAVETLAARLGRDLAAEGVEVLAIGGAGNVRRFLATFGPDGEAARLAGLCDAREERAWARAVEETGLGPAATRAELERLGFFVCEADLEDELIRALGPPAVERLLERQNELGLFRSFQQQPAQRERPVEAQLRRFLGTRRGRKIAYGALLVQSLPLERVPRPLAGVLAHVRPLSAPT